MSSWGRVRATRFASETPNEFLSGYEVEFVNAVDEDLFCSICKLPLRKPVQTRCGHRFCKGCINKVCERQNSGNPRFNCPVCRASQSPKEDVFPDNAAERKILSLVIKCPNRKCKWTGELRDREKHLASCPEKVVKCTSKNCTEKMAKKDLANHVTTCQWRMIGCRHCGTQHPRCQLSTHYLECKKIPVDCPNKCGETIPREETWQHLAYCPEKVIKCTSKNCTKTMARKNLEEHVASTCQWRMIRCEHCGMQHPACQQLDHQLKCKRFPVNCPNNCRKVIPRNEIKAHIETDCPLALVSCPYAKLGCPAKVLRKSIDSHIQSASGNHIDLACDKLIKTSDENEKLKKTTEKLEEELRNTLKEHGQLKERTRKLEEKLYKTDNERDYILTEHEQLKERTRKIEEKLDLRRYDQIVATQKKLEQDIFTIKTQPTNKITKVEEKLRNTLKEHEQLKERTRKLEEKLYKTDNERDYILTEHEQLKERTRKIEEKLDLRKYDQIVATQKKLEQDIFTIKTQLANKVTKRETLDMINERTSGRESGLDRRLPNSQDSKLEQFMKEERIRELEVKLVLRQYDLIEATQRKLEQEIFTIKTQLANNGDFTDRQRRDIDDAVSRQILPLALVASQQANRPAMAPQAPQMQVMPAPIQQFMHMWFGACGWR